MAGEKLYIVFDEQLIKQINVHIKRSYYYYENGSKVFLKETKLEGLTNSSLFIVDDEKRRWLERRHDRSLYLNIKFSCENVYFIFYGENKACHSNATLGIGLEWKARESRIKCCRKIGIIDKTLDNFEANLCDIEIENPNSDIEFSWFIYIANPGFDTGSKNDSNKYANTKGLIIAKKLCWTIVVSGSGSIFPIEECAKREDPLWSIRTNFVDWAQDDFSNENVAVIFNPAHPLYPSINYGAESFDENIFKEVMSSALASLIFQIINDVRENGCDYELLNKEPIESTGSILAAVRYFKDARSIEIGKNLDVLIKSVKVFFDKENI